MNVCQPFHATPLKNRGFCESSDQVGEGYVQNGHHGNVGAVRHAVHAEKVGYDCIYAAGIEEGGIRSPSRGRGISI